LTSHGPAAVVERIERLAQREYTPCGDGRMVWSTFAPTRATGEDKAKEILFAASGRPEDA
jgi:hypothetical protein